MWDHFTKPHDIASPDINSPSQSSDEIMSSHKQELLNAEQTLEENIKAAKEMISRLQKEEMERTQLEEQAATIALRAIAQAYPRTPEIGQRSYQARQQIGEIEHQYQFKYGAIRDKYEAAFRQQRDELQSAYESEVAAIKSGTVTATSQPGTKRAVTALKSSPAIRPLLDSPQNVIPSEISYSVVGIAPGDTLNVRIGAGASYDIVARLPSGFSGLRIVGPPVMNDTTEWVQIAFDKHTGWVAKLYLKAQ